MDVPIVAVLFAHQGGWDEILLIGGPIVAIVGLLWLAKRRVDAASSPVAEGSEPTNISASTDTD